MSPLGEYDWRRPSASLRSLNSPMFSTTKSFTLSPSAYKSILTTGLEALSTRSFTGSECNSLRWTRTSSPSSSGTLRAEQHGTTMEVTCLPTLCPHLYANEADHRQSYSFETADFPGILAVNRMLAGLLLGFKSHRFRQDNIDEKPICASGTRQKSALTSEFSKTRGPVL